MSRPVFIPVFIAVALMCGMAHASEASNVPTTASSSARAKPELCVQIVSGPNPLDEQLVRAAIEKELGLPTKNVVSPASVGTVRVESGYGTSVTISYASADGSTQLTRRIALPVDSARRATVIAWVVGNLVRNEADEILLAMMNHKATSAKNDDSPETSVAAANESSSDTLVEAEANADTKPPATSAGERAPATAGNVQIASSGISLRKPARPSPRVFHAGFFSPVAFPTDAAAHTFNLSLSAAYGHVGALDGFGVGLLVDRIESRSNGFQLSGLWTNHNDYKGALVAGLALRGRGSLQGVQLAGVATYVDNDLAGAQIAGLAVTTRGNASGLQLGGAVAYSSADAQGAQIGGIASMAYGHMSGLQLSGGFNYAQGSMTGSQISGAVNVATDAKGLQVGVVNVAHDVEGLQLGIVNVARHNRGLALGLFNWSQGARLQPIVFYQNPGYFSAGYRTLSGHSTGTISFGYDPATERARTRFATGPRFAFGRFAVGAEFGYGWVLEHMKNSPSDRAHELELVGIASVEVVRNLVTVYGGGGVVLPVAGVVAIEPHGTVQGGVAIF